MIIYRKATTDDFFPALVLWYKIWDMFIVTGKTPGLNDYNAIAGSSGLLKRYISGERIMIVAADGAKIVGAVGADVNESSIKPPLCVDSNYHRKGIATELLNKMVCELKIAGCDLIKVDSSEYAIPFYKKSGFIQTGSKQQHNGFTSTPMEYAPNEIWDVYDCDRNKTGRLHERGKPMQEGDYHLVVQVWMMNSTGEFLISKQISDTGKGKWMTTGGCAVIGDDGLSAALRETKEELGIILDPGNGQLFKQDSFKHTNDGGSAFFDVWLFRQDVDISAVVFQPGETCDAMWASKEKIKRMIDEDVFMSEWYTYLNELFCFCDKPFWEIGYRDKTASTFAKGATSDIAGFYRNLKPNSFILDVGCGEGRNSIFLAEQRHTVDAFDLSEAGIEKAKLISAGKGLDINFFVCDLESYIFEKDYDVIISHGVLHLPEKAVRDNFITKAQKRTKPGGYNIIGVFTDRLPATPDNAPFTKSLFGVGELPAKYAGWTILSHEENTFRDSHPGGVSHQHAYERIIARKAED